MPERKAPKCCGICWHPLDQKNGRYLHGREDTDHEAVLVDWDWNKVVLRCDFCDQDTPVMGMSTLPVADFTLFLRGPTGLVPLWASNGGWMACSECADYLALEDWDGLFDYVLSFKPEDEREEARLWFSLVYPKMRQHITGPVRPFELGDEAVPTP